MNSYFIGVIEVIILTLRYIYIAIFCYPLKILVTIEMKIDTLTNTSQKPNRLKLREYFLGHFESNTS